MRQHGPIAAAAMMIGALLASTAPVPCPPPRPRRAASAGHEVAAAALRQPQDGSREPAGGPLQGSSHLWVFQRAGLPVEIVGEFETWRRIRDSEGTEGWVLHSLLSGRRTAIVNAGPEKNGIKPDVPLRSSPDDTSADEARLQTGVIGSVKKCTAAGAASSSPCRASATWTATSGRTGCGAYIRTRRWISTRYGAETGSTRPRTPSLRAKAKQSREAGLLKTWRRPGLRRCARNDDRV